MVINLNGMKIEGATVEDVLQLANLINSQTPNIVVPQNTIQIKEETVIPVPEDIEVVEIPIASEEKSKKEKILDGIGESVATSKVITNNKTVAGIPDGYISENELVMRSHKSLSTIKRHREKGLNYVVVNGKYYYDEKESLEHFLKKGESVNMIIIPDSVSNTVRMGYTHWIDNLVKKCRDAGIYDTREVFKNAYFTLRNDYGIVWEQVRIDAFRQTGETLRSTSRLVYYLEYEQPHPNNPHVYDNLFEGVLDDEIKKILSAKNKRTI